MQLSCACVTLPCDPAETKWDHRISELVSATSTPLTTGGSAHTGSPNGGLQWGSTRADLKRVLTRSDLKRVLKRVLTRV